MMAHSFWIERGTELKVKQAGISAARYAPAAAALALALMALLF
jgi:hypothetical protein